MKTTTEKIPSRFVVLFHEFPTEHDRTNHWDLMLERNGKLLTWSLTVPLEPGESIPAKRLPDHRIEFLQYEGRISNDRGSVSRVLRGTYCWKDSPEHRVVALAFDSRQWEIRFQPQQEPDVLITVSEI